MNRREVKSAPVLRFKGFTNDWEQRKLGDISEIIRGASPRPISDPKWFNSNSNIGWLRISDVTAQHGRIQHLSQHISILGQAKTRVISTPHLLLSIAASVGYPVINYVKTGVHDGFLIFENPKFNIDFGFYWLAFYKHEWQKFGQPGSQVNLNSSIVKKTNIGLPDNVEQKAIVHLLKLIDNRITLQQRKLESFQFTYHEIIRRLFLKKAKWQQTKLSDLVTILDKNRKPVKKEDRLFGDTPYYGANGIQDYISGFTHKGEFILIAEDGANSLTEYPIYFVKGQIWVNNHAHVLKVNKDVSPLFLALALKQINYSKYTVGSSRNKLNLKDLENIAIFIPDNNEQQKIGQFYSNYLNYLRINKKRIQYMKQFKQFLLQNMFI
ncbi:MULTISPECIES: restriction endonuclease subunit S [unclassified Lactobacillus]|uniref:restriction endonuclease subunit S n=1 Tax=unclassified Lactobacillus TaxID=2620435 RepID=UPI000BEEC46F|nr:MULTISPECIES: restriction endonuclease subunit S [unclassified Lactobacillus]PEG86352.1 restriction endonuclease subunit S [Lactobacillus sp. UMNPBX14]PEH01904.1 restriction endonuclease subunit S [Lactobacillus sp. UMNPBX6]